MFSGIAVAGSNVRICCRKARTTYKRRWSRYGCWRAEPTATQSYVNGNWLSEPYVPSQYGDLSDFGPLKVPSNSYFVLGDHRNSSNDSRAFGTVARRLIHGRAVLAYWPVSHFGSLSATASTQRKNKVSP